MVAGLDSLLTALYVELTDRIIPWLGRGGRGPGRQPEVTDAELVCLAVARVLLRFDDERHWLRARVAAGRLPFPRLLGQSEYNQRVKAAGPRPKPAASCMPGAAGTPEPWPAYSAWGAGDVASVLSWYRGGA